MASNELAAWQLAFNFQMDINQSDNRNDLGFSAANSNRKQEH